MTQFPKSQRILTVEDGIVTFVVAPNQSRAIIIRWSPIVLWQFQSVSTPHHCCSAETC